MAEDKPQINPVIKEIEDMYPEMTKEFKRIMREQYETFCIKQSNPDSVNWIKKQWGKYAGENKYNFCYECWLDSLFGVIPQVVSEK